MIYRNNMEMNSYLKGNYAYPIYDIDKILLRERKRERRERERGRERERERKRERERERERDSSNHIFLQ